MGSLSGLIDESALIDNTAEFIHHYLATRLLCKDPDGNEVIMRVGRPDLYLTYFEVAIDMFHAGASWSDTTSGREEKTIIITK